jgi:hypothetical protein
MSDTKKPALYALTPEAHATVLAALRFYQTAFAACDAPPASVREIATNGGAVQPLDGKQIDQLCESLNQHGLDFSAIVPLFAELAQHSPYVAAAQRMAKEGEIEVDDPAVVSKGDDDGAYVMAWMWVSNHAAGIDVENEAGLYVAVKLVDDPDNTVWYFPESQSADACYHIGFNSLLMTTEVIDELPEGATLADMDEFKAWVTTFGHQKRSYQQ